MKWWSENCTQMLTLSRGKGKGLHNKLLLIIFAVRCNILSFFFKSTLRQILSAIKCILLWCGDEYRIHHMLSARGNSFALNIYAKCLCVWGGFFQRSSVLNLVSKDRGRCSCCNDSGTRVCSSGSEPVAEKIVKHWLEHTARAHNLSPSFTGKWRSLKESIYFHCDSQRAASLPASLTTIFYRQVQTWAF